MPSGIERKHSYKMSPVEWSGAVPEEYPSFLQAMYVTVFMKLKSMKIT